MSSPLWRDDIDPARDPYRVMIVKGELRDARRDDRRVPYKLYYPQDFGRPAPVILWSHGLGGSRDGASFLARFLCAQGYAILNIQHPGTDSSLWEGKPGHPWDVIRATKIPRSASLQRFKDVPFVLDRLSDIAAAHPDAGAVMDLNNLGMSGHSFGGMTTQMMAGQRYPDENGSLVQFKETRFRAGVLYSPVPISHVTDAPLKDLYGDITLPLLHMTGTDDESPVEKFGYRERMAVYENSAGPRGLLVMNDGDHMVYNGSRGKLAENPKRGLHEQIIRIGALAWWDWWLKADDGARDWMANGGFSRWLNGDGTYSQQMP